MGVLARADAPRSGLSPRALMATGDPSPSQLLLWRLPNGNVALISSTFLAGIPPLLFSLSTVSSHHSWQLLVCPVASLRTLDHLLLEGIQGWVPMSL